MVALGDVVGAVCAKVEHNRQIDTFWLQPSVVVTLETSCLAALVVFLLVRNECASLAILMHRAART